MDTTNKPSYINFDAQRAILASDVTWPSKYLFLAMWTKADARTGKVWGDPSYKELAALTGMSPSTVKKGIKELESGGWVNITRPTVRDAIRSHDSNSYMLTVPRSSPDLGHDEEKEKVLVSACVSDDLGRQTTTSSIRTINSAARSADAARSALKVKNGSEEKVHKGKPVCLTCSQSWHDCDGNGKTTCAQLGMTPQKYCLTCKSGDAVWLYFGDDASSNAQFFSCCVACDGKVWEL